MSDSRNRLKILRISGDLLIQFFLLDGKRLLKAEGMPADAKIVAMSSGAGFEKNELWLRIHSETFPEVMEGHTHSEIVVTYTAETPEHHLEQKGIDVVLLEANGKEADAEIRVDPGHFRFREYKPKAEKHVLNQDATADTIFRERLQGCGGPVVNMPWFSSQEERENFLKEWKAIQKDGNVVVERLGIAVESAGVDPAHQTGKCDFCACQLSEGEGLQTCTAYKHVTLCPECYKKAGNTVR